MKYIATLTILLLFASANADSSVNCDDLIGMWQGERYDASLGLSISENAYLGADGTFAVSFVVDDGAQQFRTYQSGRWMCAHGYLTTMIERFGGSPAAATATYRIDMLTPDYFSYTLENIDGTGLNNNEMGTNYENYSVEEPDDGHGC